MEAWLLWNILPRANQPKKQEAPDMNRGLLYSTALSPRQNTPGEGAEQGGDDSMQLTKRV